MTMRPFVEEYTVKSMDGADFGEGRLINLAGCRRSSGERYGYELRESGAVG